MHLHLPRLRLSLALAVSLGLPGLGCANVQPASLVAERNRVALDSLDRGITREEVLAALETAELRVREGTTARSMRMPTPHHELELPGPQRVEVFFVYTRVSVDDGLATLSELTPGLLVDGRYVGAGWPVLERWLGPRRVEELELAESEREMEEERLQAAREARRWDPVEEEHGRAVWRGTRAIHLMNGLQGLQGF